jgi:hypothetical protein
MNIEMLQRALRRQYYVKPRSAYTDFLRGIGARGDVWMVPQREVAAWWEARQAAEIRIVAAGGGGARISCDLERAVVEIDGKELRIPPFETAASSEAGRGDVCIAYDCCTRLASFALEVFGHFGYGHVRPQSADRRPDIQCGDLEPILDRLRRNALLHWNYVNEDIEALRGLVRRAHRARGLPELRLWPLPHYRGRPHRVCVSSRFDVDRAIVNMPLIHEIEGKCGLRSTAYLRPMGPFYGAREITRYRAQVGGNEIALHGEFATTARRRFGDETAAAAAEKKLLEEIIGERVAGVCMHGGELHYNVTENTRGAIEAARFKYETMYQNQYYLPLHLPAGDGVMRTLSIGQHLMDVSVPVGPGFVADLRAAFDRHLSQAESVGGVFVPVLHPLYFSIAHYLRYPENTFRLAAFVPKYLVTAARMRRSQSYLNTD